MNRKIKAALITGALALGAVGAATAPALASTNPPPSSLNATVTVSPTLSLSLSANAITFSQSTPGSGFKPADQQITVTVGGNEAWQLFWTPSTVGESFTDGGANGFPVHTNMQFQGVSTSAAGDPFIPGMFADADQNVQVDGASGASTSTDVFAYQLKVPANQAAATYAAGFQYLVTGA